MGVVYFFARQIPTKTFNYSTTTYCIVFMMKIFHIPQISMIRKHCSSLQVLIQMNWSTKQISEVFNKLSNKRQSLLLTKLSRNLRGKSLWCLNKESRIVQTGRANLNNFTLKGKKEISICKIKWRNSKVQHTRILQSIGCQQQVLSQEANQRPSNKGNQ